MAQNNRKSSPSQFWRPEVHYLVVDPPRFLRKFYSLALPAAGGCQLVNPSLHFVPLVSHGHLLYVSLIRSLVTKIRVHLDIQDDDIFIQKSQFNCVYKNLFPNKVTSICPRN
jgi:hypothetical protein